MNRKSRTDDIHPAKAEQQMPWLEWLASAIGVLLVLGIFGVIGWQAFNGATVPPVITVEVENVAPVDGGYRVLFRARNRTGEAAAQVEIEGKVTAAGEEEETSKAIPVYAPDHSARQGGLFLTDDPHSGPLAVRAIGFAKP